MSELTDERRVGHNLAKDRLIAGDADRRCGRWPVWSLLVVFAVAFLFGLAGHWLFGNPAGSSGMSMETVEPVTSWPSDGRLIDLSALDEERSTTMKRFGPLSIGIAVLFVIGVVGALLAILYNGLVSAREQVNAGWAQVANVYQRRLDLIPILVDAVQTYTEHERATLEALTQARSNAARVSGAIGGAPRTAEQIQAVEASQGEVASALARLFAVVENYPDLKASRNFLTLQDQIEGTENRVTVERRSYNELARRYNTRLQTFPSNLIATQTGFEAKPYFQAEAGALQGLSDPFGRREG